MRLMKGVRLRVLDVDFDYNQIVVRNAKGNKDRVVPLPKKYKLTLEVLAWQPINFPLRIALLACNPGALTESF